MQSGNKTAESAVLITHAPRLTRTSYIVLRISMSNIRYSAFASRLTPLNLFLDPLYMPPAKSLYLTAELKIATDVIII